MKKTIIYYFRQCKKALKNFSCMIENFLILIIIYIIKFYNFFVSPALGIKCRFLPTCSEYCQESLLKHGLLHGSFYSLKRILRCHPFKILGSGYGLDLVPKKSLKSKELN